MPYPAPRVKWSLGGGNWARTAAAARQREEEGRAMSKACPKRDGLFDRWNAASNALRDLEAVKIAAIRYGDPQVAQWDTRIEGAREDERLAQREYERHLAIHGCNE